MVGFLNAAEGQRISTLLQGLPSAKKGSPATGTGGAAGGQNWHMELYRYAGIPDSQAGRQWRLLLVIAGFGCLAGLFLWLPLLLIGFLAALAEFVRLRLRSRRRAELFERDYTALLVSLASSVRTGMDPLVALTSARQLFKPGSTMYLELQQLADILDRGSTEEEALQSFAATIRHPDIQLFRSAFLLARREGSSLAECLHRLAKVTRQRQSFRRKIRASVAMQRMSAIGIAGCAIIIGLIQFSSNPDSMKLALAHPMGARALAGGGSLILIGLIWMLGLSRSRI